MKKAFSKFVEQFLFQWVCRGALAAIEPGELPGETFNLHSL